MLDCAIQAYAWGKLGNDSSVAQFKAAHSKDFKIDPSKTYAELWMGTHQNGPSIIKKMKLNEYLGTEIPFLFKILSVNQALSIQAHPNKQLAAVLHEKDPKNYPDANHKPEMLIALTKFQALCGFRPSSELKKHFESIPTLVKLCNEVNIDEFYAKNSESTLRSCFSSMMNRDETFIRERFEEFLSNYESYSLPAKLTDLFLRLHNQYPFDIGCFSIFLLNYYELEPNEAIYLQANIPHAYLYGEGVECMACSDNVVRAGLTPKFKDVKTLVDMLDYKMNSLDANLVKPTRFPAPYDFIHEYKPLVDEFSVQRIEVLKNGAFVKLPVMNKYSILIIIDAGDNINAFINEDEIIEVKKGFVFFIEKNVEVKLSVKDELLLAYRAYCNIDE
jgi:mannose-6-phosphate isomerase